MADVVVLNDPITGQGSNTASKAAKMYMSGIQERGDKPFDARGCSKPSTISGPTRQWVVKWTNSLLTPPPPHILQLMGAASQIPPLASRIANGFNNPPDYNPWWFDPNEAQKLIAKQQAGRS